MRNRHYVTLLLVTLLASTSRGDVVSFTSLDLFLEAVDDIRIIDFATLPDGSPSIPGTPITPEFNYTDQGATFASPFPDLAIGTFDGNSSATCNGLLRSLVKIGKLAPFALRWYVIAHAARDGE